MNRRLSISLATALAVALLAPACTDSTDEAASADRAASAPAVSNDWALTYVGGSEGKADPSLEPIVIGYANQEGGVPAFPEATVGTEAAVKYINEELGGIDGHPLELKTCLVQAEEDGQKCGTEFVNDPNVKLVLTGVLTVGAESLYKVVVPKLPVISGNPVTIPEFLTPGVVALTPGSPGVIQGLAVFIANHLGTSAEPIETVAVIYGDNDGAKAAVSSLFTPVLNQLGITDVKAVPVPDTATAPDLQAALQASGAAEADVVVSLVVLPLCIATYDAMKALGITPTVVTTGLCLGTAMTQHLEDVGDSGEVPDGWYFGDYGYSYFQPDDESGMTTYLSKVAKYGGDDVEYTGFAGPQFANVMTIAKFFNAIGPDQLSTDAVNAQIESFEGPMMLVAGPMACGEVSPVFVTLCGRQIGIEQYADGEWKSVADALNGKPIDPAAELAEA